MVWLLLVVVLHVERQPVLTYYGFEEDGDGSGHVQAQRFQHPHGLFLQFGVEAHGRGRRVRHGRSPSCRDMMGIRTVYLQG